MGLAANFVGNFSDVEIVVSGFAEFGDGDVNSVPDSAEAIALAALGAGSLSNNGGGSVEDSEIFGVGATISYAGFSLGGGYVDLGEGGLSQADEAAGADNGEWWNIGIGYRSGPWGVSIAYYEAEIGNVAGVGDTTYEVISIDAEYEVAPGWVIAANLNFADAENRDRTQNNDNDGTAGILYNIFTF